MALFAGQQVGIMDNYKLTLRLPKAYGRHISTLKGIKRKETNEELIRELIDQALSSQFSDTPIHIS